MKRISCLALAMALILLGCVDEKDNTPSGGEQGGQQGGEQGGECKATFTYVNQWTNVASGGEADWNVYLVGSMNEWAPLDSNMKMTSDKNGTHTITIDVKKGETYEYKFYVEGWDPDNWKTIEEDGESNAKAVITECGMKFGSADKPETPPPVVVDPPAVEEGDCAATFVYVNKYTNVASGGEQDFDVYLAGTMSEWEPKDASMKMTSDKNGTHTITLNLKKGVKYKYKHYIDGWGDDSWRANSSACADGDCNSEIDMSTCDQTVTFVDIPLGTTGGETGGSGEGGSTGGGEIHVASGTVALASVPKVEDKKVTIEVKLADGVTIKSVTRNDGTTVEATGTTIEDTVTENNKYVYSIIGSDDSELYVPVWVEDKKFDWHDAVLYFAFTDRFKDGDSSNNNPQTDASHSGSSDARWLGGDFKGMQQVVESGYFDKLGINTLWISSVSMNAQGISWGSNGDTHSYSAYHSYWPVSSFMTSSNITEITSGKSSGVQIQAIEPHFGSMEDLRNLVDSCHKRGIRVVVDFAANQVHKDSPIFQNHRNWFNDVDKPVLCDDNGGWGWNNYSEKCWFSADLPDINYENNDARKQMVDHAIWLIKETNIDGFRVDAVKHMSVQFIKDLRTATDKLFANTGSMFYMVGETFTPDVGLLNKYIGDDLLHAQFDFPFYYAIKDHILGTGNYASVAQLNNYFKSDLMGTFMGNHDVARAISVAAKDNQNKWGNNREIDGDDAWKIYLKVKAALTILLTNPGVPLIYYGDEYGMEGANDPDNRRMMEFDSQLNGHQAEMLAYIQKLGQIRKSYPSITRGHRENLSYGGGYWCYKLTGSEGKDVIVGLSRADAGDNSGCSLGKSYTLKNLLSDGHEVSTKDGLDLSSDHLQVYEVQ